MNRSTPGLRVLALGAVLLGFACEDKKSSSETPRPEVDAGQDKYATADPKLTKALQAAAALDGGAENGPPPAGVFAAGAADQRHPKGVPTKIDLINDGGEPRIALAPSMEALTDAAHLSSSYGPAVLEMAMQMGPRTAAPTIDFGIMLAPAKKDEGGNDWLVADVRKASPAKEQLGQLPAGTDKEIASLEGTRVRIHLTPDGRASELELQLGKAARPELGRLAQNAAEALVVATVPLPTKPVGVGAQWFAESRLPLAGIDTVAYRAFRVKSIDGDRVRLALDIKAYATSGDVQLPGVPKGATLEQFDAEGQGELEIVRRDPVARKYDVQERVIMIFQAPGAAQAPTPPGQPQGNMLTAQLQSQATFARGEDLRAAMRP